RGESRARAPPRQFCRRLPSREYLPRHPALRLGLSGGRRVPHGSVGTRPGRWIWLAHALRRPRLRQSGRITMVTVDGSAIDARIIQMFEKGFWRVAELGNLFKVRPLLFH